MTYQFIEKDNFIYCDPLGYLQTEKFIIYNLVDPSDNQIRYIGQTTRGIKRLDSHFYKSQLKAKSYKNSWIKSVFSKNLKPIVLVTHKANSQEELDNLEKQLIATFNECVNLTNRAEGGNGRTSLNPKQKKITYRKWKEAPNYEERAERLRTLAKESEFYICIQDQYGNYYRSITEAAKKVNSGRGNIRKHLNGIHSHIKGYKFKEIMKGSLTQIDAYIAACQAVKTKYPKPE